MPLIVNHRWILKITHGRVFYKLEVIRWILQSSYFGVSGNYFLLIQCEKDVKVLHVYNLIQIFCVILEIGQTLYLGDGCFRSSMGLFVSRIISIKKTSFNWRLSINNFIVNILLRFCSIVKAEFRTGNHAIKESVAETLFAFIMIALVSVGSRLSSDGFGTTGVNCVWFISRKRSLHAISGLSYTLTGLLP